MVVFPGLALSIVEKAAGTDAAVSGNTGRGLQPGRDPPSRLTDPSPARAEAPVGLRGRWRIAGRRLLTRTRRHILGTFVTICRNGVRLRLLPSPREERSVEIQLRGTWSSWLTAFGAVGTALAATMVLLTLLYTARSERSERAAEIRSDLSAFAHGSELLLDHVQEGSVFVTAVTNIHDELMQRVDESFDMDEIRDYMGDEQLRRSVVVAGLQKPGSERIHFALTGLQSISYRLDGRLMIFRAIHALSEGIVRKSLSVERFMAIAGSLVDDDATFPDDPRALRATLQSATSTHYASNNLAPAVRIDGFVQSLIATPIALPNDALLTLSRPLSRATHGQLQESKRYTEDISILLAELKPTIGEPEFESLSATLAELNEALN